jgi:hypothetical protein
MPARMEWSLPTAIAWSERGIALALLLQTIELLQLRYAYSDTGIWRWSSLRREHARLPAPLRWLLAGLLPYRNFIGLLLVRLVCVAMLPYCFAPVLLPLLWLSQVAICVRFRGTFNGGSDYMTVLILMTLSIAELARSHPLLQKACLLYCAVQVTLSYGIAGIAKIKEADWRSGSALRDFITCAPYATPTWAKAWLGNARIAWLASWSVIAFECLFPISWIDPRVCLGVLALGLCFHVANGLVFGLNRFLFAWAAAYPALLYASQWLAHSS